jgi:hypothetical protein
MSQQSRWRRFDPRRGVPMMGGDGASLFEESDAALAAKAEEPTADLERREFDEALEQVGSEGFRVCPLCGAIVPRDRSVLR